MAAKTKSQPKAPDPSIAIIEPLRVDIPEAARILGVSRSRIYLRIRDGSLAAVKEGGRTLIAVSELRSYVDRTNRTEGAKLAS